MLNARIEDLLLLTVAFVWIGCSEAKVSEARSDCQRSTTLGFEAFNSIDIPAMTNGGFILTFPFTEPVKILGLEFNAGVDVAGAIVTVSVYKITKVDGLFIDPSPEYSFNAQLASTDNRPRVLILSFPEAFSAGTVEEHREWAIGVRVTSGRLTLQEGYVPNTNHIQRRYSFSYDGSSWAPSSEKGISMGLRLEAECL